MKFLFSIVLLIAGASAFAATPVVTCTGQIENMDVARPDRPNLDPKLISKFELLEETGSNLVSLKLEQTSSSDVLVSTATYSGLKLVSTDYDGINQSETKTFESPAIKVFYVHSNKFGWKILHLSRGVFNNNQFAPETCQ